VAQRFVLVVEDDPDWQRLFEELVNDAGFNPVIVSTYKAAKAALAARDYALAVVDISLSLPNHADRGGVKVLEEILKISPKLPAIVVTGYATVDLAIETLVTLDAANFFKKETFNRRQFVQVVKNEAKSGAIHSLSEREWEVLQLMSQGLTNKQIAELLTVSVNTVKKHVQSIFTKLNVSTRAAAVAQAIEQDQ